MGTLHDNSLPAAPAQAAVSRGRGALTRAAILRHIYDYMKIQAGVGTKEEFEFFLRAGADEFYCGFKSIPSHLYGGESFASPAEIEAAVRAAHSAGKTFYLAANEMQAGSLKSTAAFISEMAARGIDGVIFRDPALPGLIKPAGRPLEFILSSLAPCYNQRALEFYKGLGVTRLALPEQLLPSEAAGIIKNKWGIGTEMFLTASEYCVVLNGLCYLKQFDGHCLCRKEFRPAGRKKFVMPKPTAEQHFAALYDFHALGVQTLKVGRHPAKDYAKVLFAEISAVNKLLEARLEKREFLKAALKHHAKIFSFMKKCIQRP